MTDVICDLLNLLFVVIIILEGCKIEKTEILLENP